MSFANAGCGRINAIPVQAGIHCGAQRFTEPQRGPQACAAPLGYAVNHLTEQPFRQVLVCHPRAGGDPVFEASLCFLDSRLRGNDCARIPQTNMVNGVARWDWIANSSCKPRCATRLRAMQLNAFADPVIRRADGRPNIPTAERSPNRAPRRSHWPQANGSASRPSHQVMPAAMATPLSVSSPRPDRKF